MRIPQHIGVIPDGNRRWALSKDMPKQDGYAYGLNPGLELLRLARQYGIKEISYYGFTTDNCKRPSEQISAFQKACVDSIKIIEQEDGVALLVVGNSESPMFPHELKPYTTRRMTKADGIPEMKVNFLVNYGWEWDLKDVSPSNNNRKSIMENLQSREVSRIDMILRWGGRKRLSGFLPVQSVYADIYTIDEMWPDFCPEHFYKALDWYNGQDITLGG